MSAGAVTTLSANFSVVLAFLVPSLLPLMVRLFSEGGQIHVAMGGMVGLFLILMIDISWRWYRSALTLLTLEVHNGQLITKLKSEIAERQQIEEDLRKARDFLEERVSERTAELQQAIDRVKVLRGCFPSARAARRSGMIKATGRNWKSISTSTLKLILPTASARIVPKDCSKGTSNSSAESAIAH
jgi:C4-dicarboxylate-specific signal transduction histidine kinase